MGMTDDDYLTGYAQTDIHGEMIADRARTTAYRRAILAHSSEFEGKVVLDVGCGTGILSLFAAEAGAKHVYAVDASEIALVARKVVETNNLSDTITVFHGKMEDLELPEKVDVIISEWMGYFLIFERMLDSVLFARDRWLKPDGILLPSHARLSVCAIEDFDYEDERFSFWKNVYGYDLSPVAEQCRSEAVVDEVNPDAIVTNYQTVLAFNIQKMDVNDQDFSSDFVLIAERTDQVHAIVASFDVRFGNAPGAVVLSTDPDAEHTHWKQTLLYLDRPLRVRKGEKLHGTITVKRNPKSPRNLVIELIARSGRQVRTRTYHM